MADTPFEDKYTQVISASKVGEDDAAVDTAVKKILDEHFDENNNKEVYKFLFNTIDLTTLKATDTPSSVARFTEAVNDFEEQFPSLPNVAAICVYPNFASVVRTVLEVTGVRIACVREHSPRASRSKKSRLPRLRSLWLTLPTKSTSCSM